VDWAEAYLCTKLHLDPSNRLTATDMAENWGLCPFGRGAGSPVLFCSLAVLHPRVGHTMDILSPFISILCHFD